MEFRKSVRINVCDHFFHNHLISDRIHWLTKLRREINVFLGSMGHLNSFSSVPLRLCYPYFCFVKKVVK